ncbi:histidine phosphatase family protein [Frankia sp. Cas3]|uniref:histidine phosphatase family protein n=1 Tax=Frankia sp. Cas3 TaxID=3073926 RepID=UPI002AD2C872|nr:histidine phosphatase family protein [Frankia sp. Cas3]
MLLRHGETGWSRSGRHTGVTDVPLTPAGEKQAARLADRLAAWSFVLVAASPRQRALRTAELAGLTRSADHCDRAAAGAGVARFEVWDDLAEWNYGEFEGVTTPDIRRSVPDWTVWTGPTGGGETPAQVGGRADVVIGRVLSYLERGDVALAGHGHMLRVLVARWLELDPVLGARFVLDAGGLSILGHEHETRAVLRLNEPA